MAITRRGFVASLIGLPLIKWFAPKARIITPKKVPDELFLEAFKPRPLQVSQIVKCPCGTDCGISLFESMRGTKPDSEFYMPDAEVYPGLEDEISVNGAYSIGDTFLMPKIFWQDREFDPTTDDVASLLNRKV